VLVSARQRSSERSTAAEPTLRVVLKESERDHVGKRTQNWRRGVRIVYSMANTRDVNLSELRIHSTHLDDAISAILHTILFVRAPNIGALRRLKSSRLTLVACPCLTRYLPLSQPPLLTPVL
jgi:hypothetical protein